MIGAVYGNYEVVATLGQGGMGAVFLGEHRRISRRAAIKVLAPELTRDPDALRRFFDEARATSLIHHPGIVEVYDCDVDAGGQAYIVMEYLQGETLAQRIARVGRLPIDEACVFAGRIAQAVGAAHDVGIIHRDLKPENVMLVTGNPDLPAPEIPLKVLDFGIAKLLSPAGRGRTKTRSGSLLGTPAYMSPEQCQGTGTIDQRADVYSLGCILFEAICGRPPFDEKAIRVLLAAHSARPAPRASELEALVPPWLDRLIASMLAKQPAQRPGSMREVVLAVEACDFHDAPTISGADAVAAPAPSLATMATAARRRRVILAMCGGVVAAVAGSSAVALLQGHASKRPAPAMWEERPGKRVETAIAKPASAVAVPTPNAAMVPAERAVAPPEVAREDDPPAPPRTAPLQPRPHRRRSPNHALSAPDRSGTEPQRPSPQADMDGIVDL